MLPGARVLCIRVCSCRSSGAKTQGVLFELLVSRCLIAVGFIMPKGTDRLHMAWLRSQLSYVQQNARPDQISSWSAVLIGEHKWLMAALQMLGLWTT